MDKVKALDLEAKLKGQVLQDWEISSLINFGKSAAVFKGVNVADGGFVAIKIFDDELIEKYGDTAQIKRIERELELIGKSHPNMVKILGGGFDSLSNNHFIVMEFLTGRNIKDALGEIPMDNVPSLVAQLANCCQYLETLGLAHRDIKPENIVISEDHKTLTLLDFGVVRPFGRGDITDDNGIQSFVGTLQYSSPEFLLRQEEDTVDGWRALTFYQISAVTHDLIMRKPIFSDSVQPYARLVNAVQFDTPVIDSTAVPSYLIEAAKMGLIKDFRKRLSVLKWSSFSPPSPSLDPLAAIRERVSKRSVIVGSPADDLAHQQQDAARALLEDVITNLKVKARAIRNGNSSAFPPINIYRESDVLCIRFGRSLQHDLKGDLNIWLDVQIIDPAAELIKVLARASLSVGEKLKPPKDVMIFYGHSSSGDLSASIECLLYEALDQSQGVPAETEGVFLQISSTASEAAND